MTRRVRCCDTSRFGLIGLVLLGAIAGRAADLSPLETDWTRQLELRLKPVLSEDAKTASLVASSRESLKRGRLLAADLEKKGVNLAGPCVSPCMANIFGYMT